MRGGTQSDYKAKQPSTQSGSLTNSLNSLRRGEPVEETEGKITIPGQTDEGLGLKTSLPSTQTLMLLKSFPNLLYQHFC